MDEKQASVSDRIVELRSLKMAELWAIWDKYFPRRPAFPNRAHLESRIIYKMQEEVYGGLAPTTRRYLEAIGERHSKIKQRAKPRELYFPPGTVLIREWQEREHRVTVNSRGQFEYEGEEFKSLTSVARHITGTHWSGPAFFGLTKGA